MACTGTFGGNLTSVLDEGLGRRKTTGLPIARNHRTSSSTQHVSLHAHPSPGVVMHLTVHVQPFTSVH